MAANPSLESLLSKKRLRSHQWDYSLGALSKVAETLNFDLHGDIGWSARPLVRLRVGANRHFRKPHYLLSPGTPPPSTFDCVKWNCSRKKDADPAKYRPEGAG